VINNNQKISLLTCSWIKLEPYISQLINNNNTNLFKNSHFIFQIASDGVNEDKSFGIRAINIIF